MKKTFLPFVALLLLAFIFQPLAFSSTSKVGGVGMSGSGNIITLTMGTTTYTVGTSGTAVTSGTTGVGHLTLGNIGGLITLGGSMSERFRWLVAQ